jgi:hypothetical protein
VASISDIQVEDEQLARFDWLGRSAGGQGLLDAKPLGFRDCLSLRSGWAEARKREERDKDDPLEKIVRHKMFDFHPA